MVLRVCRASLRDTHDAQDAFQATFLVLARKARSLWVRDSLGPWLHQVALRNAACARSEADRRRRLERRMAERAARPAGPGAGLDPELERCLHEEIGRLPERYRVPLVLCDLQGLTCEEAARRMGRPVGTVKSWRARGRERLRERLKRHDVGPAHWASVIPLLPGPPAIPPRSLTEATANAAVRAAAGHLTAGPVPASAHSLASGVLSPDFSPGNGIGLPCVS